MKNFLAFFCQEKKLPYILDMEIAFEDSIYGIETELYIISDTSYNIVSIGFINA